MPALRSPPAQAKPPPWPPAYPQPSLGAPSTSAQTLVRLTGSFLPCVAGHTWPSQRGPHSVSHTPSPSPSPSPSCSWDASRTRTAQSPERPGGWGICALTVQPPFSISPSEGVSEKVPCPTCRPISLPTVWGQASPQSPSGPDHKSLPQGTRLPHRAPLTSQGHLKNSRGGVCNSHGLFYSNSF